MLKRGRIKFLVYVLLLLVVGIVLVISQGQLGLPSQAVTACNAWQYNDDGDTKYTRSCGGDERPECTHYCEIDDDGESSRILVNTCTDKCGEKSVLSVIITSPNGGEIWKAGSKQTIQWTSKNIDSNQKLDVIRLRNSRGVEIVLISGTLNDGSEQIVVPSLPEGSYTLEIKTYSSGGELIFDSSDRAFSIVSDAVCGNGICEQGEADDCPVIQCIRAPCPQPPCTKGTCQQDCGQKCATYIRDGLKKEVCATCGNSVCESYETCTSSSCNGDVCTADCGFLFCSKDCEKQGCTDSDGGKDYYTRGKTSGPDYGGVIGIIWGEDANKCSARTDNSLGYSVHYDCCSDVTENKQLNEAYCDENGKLQAEGYQCPNGCKDGACIGQIKCTALNASVCLDYDRCEIVSRRKNREACVEDCSKLSAEECPSYGHCKIVNGQCARIKPDEAFRYAKWECYDGHFEQQGGGDTCITSNGWKRTAKKSCRDKCSSDGSKCGVNSFVMSTPCEFSSVICGNGVCDNGEDETLCQNDCQGIASKSVKCIFQGSKQAEKCSVDIKYGGESYSYGCSATESCVFRMQGPKGTEIALRSSCSNSPSIIIDGQYEEISLNCAKKDIEVSVPTSFTLSERQSAIFVNYQKMGITFNKFIPQWSPPPGVGAPPAPPVVQITVSKGGGCSGGEPNVPAICTAPEILELEISQGQIKDAFGLKIKFDGIAYADPGVYSIKLASFSVMEHYNCKDSDEGADIYVKGMAETDAPESYYTSLADHCTDELSLREAYCQKDGIIGSAIYGCSNGCVNGACIREAGFRNARWECYDGYSESQGSPESCKTSETWMGYAKSSCGKRCNADSTKCGIDSFSVSNGCLT